mmetsp:Transcript_53200/g.133928  ORF Transcript_53200/g.133928 Transcript_53200/m.133928 type:complete len:286 (+) Transcript_53200:412-1269(+)
MKCTPSLNSESAVCVKYSSIVLMATSGLAMRYSAMRLASTSVRRNIQSPKACTLAGSFLCSLSYVSFLPATMDTNLSILSPRVFLSPCQPRSSSLLGRSPSSPPTVCASPCPVNDEGFRNICTRATISTGVTASSRDVAVLAKDAGSSSRPPRPPAPPSRGMLAMLRGRVGMPDVRDLRMDAPACRPMPPSSSSIIVVCDSIGRREVGSKMDVAASVMPDSRCGYPFGRGLKSAAASPNKWSAASAPFCAAVRGAPNPVKGVRPVATNPGSGVAKATLARAPSGV